MSKIMAGKVIFKVSGKEYECKGSLSYNLGDEPKLEQVESHSFQPGRVSGFITGTIKPGPSYDEFCRQMDEVEKSQREYWHQKDMEILNEIQAEMRAAIKDFIETRGKKGKPLTLGKLKKHRIKRKLVTVIRKTLMKEDERLRPWAVYDLTKASNKHLPKWGALHGLEKGEKETSKKFRERILESLRRIPGSSGRYVGE